MEINFEKGLVPAVIQDHHSGKVLMLGYMNREAYQQTLSTGLVTFFSRSRQKIWVKGETSGHHLRLRETRIDCDGDTVLIQADLTGPGCCHMGYKSCFYRKITPEGEMVIADREFDPEKVYGAGPKESQA